MSCGDVVSTAVFISSGDKKHLKDNPIAEKLIEISKLGKVDTEHATFSMSEKEAKLLRERLTSEPLNSWFKQQKLERERKYLLDLSEKSSGKEHASSIYDFKNFFNRALKPYNVKYFPEESDCY